MAHEWIAAATALRFLSDEPYTYNEQRAICERAHSGMIAARADLLVWGKEEHADARIPKYFWWAEGHEALDQNWQSGDFSTWIDQKIEVKAFGVSFDFLAINELAPAERRSVGLQRISVASDADWIPARELHRLVYGRNAIAAAGPMMVQAAAMGQIVARAVRATGAGTHSIDGKVEWAAREWDVPMWFWRDFTEATSSRQDWPLGSARGKGRHNRTSQIIELQGLHFHRSGLSSLGIADPAGASETKEHVRTGRRPTYDWGKATANVWGQIYRGDLKPSTQADIERALQTVLRRGDDEPSESTVRPHAKPIWDEFQRE